MVHVKARAGFQEILANPPDGEISPEKGADSVSKRIAVYFLGIP